MANHEKVQSAPLTSGEIFEFTAAVVEQLPRDLDPAKVRYYSAKKSRLGKALRELLAKPQEVINLPEWQDFFRRVLGRNVDLSNLHIPAKPDYLCRPIVNPGCFTPNDLYDACTKLFKTWRYTNDLNVIKDVVSRPATPYVIWVRDTEEADQDMANISANQITERKINTETLSERLIHELKFYDETKKHLDEKNYTLCASSRDPHGDVPGVRWSSVYGKMSVGWCFLDDRHDSIRARVAIS